MIGIGAARSLHCSLVVGASCDRDRVRQPHSFGDLHMPFDFKHSRVLVAGGSRGIGRAIALNFAAAGADVAICARGAEALEATRADLSRHGGRVHAMGCDLADANAIAAWVPAAAEALGGIDVLVNNASGFGMGDDRRAVCAWQVHPNSGKLCSLSTRQFVSVKAGLALSVNMSVKRVENGVVG